MKRLVGLLSLTILLLPAIVDALPITFAFNGAVSQDPLLDPNDPFGGSIAFGTPFSSSYVFESTTPMAIRPRTAAPTRRLGGCSRS